MLSHRRILVVDDDVDIQHILEQAFSRSSFMVYATGSAQEAIEIVKKKKVRVVFIDLKLSEISGVELAKQIRDYWPMTLIYAITGNLSFFQLVDCRKAGFDDYFLKPVKLDVLIQAAQDAFDKIDRWKNEKNACDNIGPLFETEMPGRSITV